MNIKILQFYLSGERMSAYEILAERKSLPIEKAVDLYLMNLAISEQLYSIISFLEVLLRNSIDKKMIEFKQSDSWFDLIGWDFYHKRKIEEAIKYVESCRNIECIRRDQIVCNVTLGFWCNLFSRKYESVLWAPALQYIFKNSKSRPTRRHVIETLQTILEFRNRISHFEPIIKDEQKVLFVYKKSIEMINWLSPEICEWIREFNRFESLYEQLAKCEF